MQGALLQEAIDVLVILNALRALSGRTPSGLAGDLLVRMAAKHRRLRTGLDELLDVADSLGNVPPVEVRRRLATVQRFLESTCWFFTSMQVASPWTKLTPWDSKVFATGKTTSLAVR